MGIRINEGLKGMDLFFHLDEATPDSLDICSDSKKVWKCSSHICTWKNKATGSETVEGPPAAVEAIEAIEVIEASGVFQPHLIAIDVNKEVTFHRDL